MALMFEIYLTSLYFMGSENTKPTLLALLFGEKCQLVCLRKMNRITDRALQCENGSEIKGWFVDKA